MSTPKPKKNTLRIAAYSTLIVCCVGFIGAMYHLQYKAAHAPVIGFTHRPDPQLVAEAEQRKKEKILELRDKWQVWAKAHQSQLRAMLQARPDDLATLAVVADAVPSFPKEEVCGITSNDLTGIANYSDPIVIGVAWNHMGMDAVALKPELEAANEKAKQQTRDYDQRWFREMRDVMVASTSSAWSKKSYCLWASGRVTEREFLYPTATQRYIPIAPSYDFLASPK